MLSINMSGEQFSKESFKQNATNGWEKKHFVFMWDNFEEAIYA